MCYDLIVCTLVFTVHQIVLSEVIFSFKINLKKIGNEKILTLKIKTYSPIWNKIKYAIVEINNIKSK
jgi:hypothetical protein